MLPRGLRTWFLVHFWADVVFAVPLLVAPEALLRTLGWTEVDPVSARLVGAALMGIGVQSLLGRDETAEAYRAMLNLKVIWSGTALLGLGLSIAEEAPPMTWAVLAVFAVFNAMWIRYRVLMGRSEISRAAREDPARAEPIR